jgi:HEAT repeat protein
VLFDADLRSVHFSIILMASDNQEGCFRMTVLYDFKLYRVKQSSVLKVFVAFWIFVSVPMVYGQPDRINQLIANLRDPSWQIRENAAAELGKIGAPAIGPLITALKNSQNDLSATTSLFPAFGAIGAIAVNPLLDLQKYDESSSAAQALAFIKDPTPAMKSLLIAINDPNANVRVGAANGLGHVKDSRAIEALINALTRDHSASVQIAAANALGNNKDMRAVKPLFAALKDSQYEVQVAASHGLASFGSPVVATLVRSLKEPDLMVCMGAARALGYIKDPRAASALSAALNSHNMPVIVGAYDFFASEFSATNNASIENLLIEALNQQDDSRQGYKMASDLLTRHGSKLAEAARQWGIKHGYSVGPFGDVLRKP